MRARVTNSDLLLGRRASQTAVKLDGEPFFIPLLLRLALQGAYYGENEKGMPPD